MKHPDRRAVLVALLPLIAEPLRAQGFQFTWPGSRPTVSVGDVDGDGVDDFARGRLLGSALPAIELRSGRTSAILYTLPGASSNDTQFGSTVLGLGDVDQDGFPDFITIGNDASLSNTNSYVSVRSGPTGMEIWNVAFPTFYLGGLARLNDLDGDGADDFALLEYSLPRVVSLRSGATGLQLLSYPVTGDASLRFAGFAAAGDVDQDGWEDLLVAWNEFAGDPQGSVDMHSGRTGALLMSIPTPTSTSFSFGSAMAGVGDVSGDGVPDFAVAAPNEFVGTLRTGRVRLYSGASGAVLQVMEQTLATFEFGESVARFPDYDGDGWDDLLIGAGTYRAGCCNYWPAEVRIYSSGTGQLLHLGEMYRSSPGITVVRDANGDGIDDYLVPDAYVQTSPVPGGASALALTGQSSPAYDLACLPNPTSQGCSPHLGAVGAPSPTQGDDFVLLARSIPPNTPGWFFCGRASASVPFASGRLCVAAPLRRLRMVTSTSGQASSCSSSGIVGSMTCFVSKAELAATGALPGEVLHVQCTYRDGGFAPPNDAGMTNALLVTIWP